MEQHKEIAQAMVMQAVIFGILSSLIIGLLATLVFISAEAVNAIKLCMV